MSGRIEYLGRMKHFALLFLLVGCAGEASLSEISPELSKSDLEGLGFTCGTYEGLSFCSLCEWTWIDDAKTDGFITCLNFYCEGDDDCEMARENPRIDYWFEAEAGRAYHSMTKGADENASSGGYVALTSSGGGSTRATFSATTPSDVVAWVRVIAPSASANSIYLQLDSGAFVHAEFPVSTQWAWRRVDGLAWHVANGSHDLRVYGGEVGVKVDRILLTSDTSFVPVADTFQAESSTLVAPMRTGAQRSIPTIGYVWVPNGAGAGGMARFPMPNAYHGPHAVWGRFNASTASDNSFSIDVNSGAPVVWELPVTVSAGWAWSRAPGTFTFGSSSVIDLKRREDGAKLDRLVVTNDPGFALVDTAPLMSTR